MKLFGLYFHLRLGNLYYVKPESGDKMWQLHIPFLTITKMGKSKFSD